MQLRVAVLRKGTPATDCNYPEDDHPDVVHFGIIHEGTAIATSSWFMKECPEKPGVAAMQLKGMAVADELQGAGLGALLIDVGLALAKNAGRQLHGREHAIAHWGSTKDLVLYRLVMDSWMVPRQCRTTSWCERSSPASARWL